MHHARTIRRLAMGAAIAAVAATGLPSVAQAATVCTYDGGSRVMTVFDGSTGPLRLVREGQFITVADQTGSIGCAGSTGLATVANTNRINVIGKSSASPFDGYIVDQSQGVLGPGASPESDGNSEIEVNIRQQVANPAILQVIGTSQPETVRVGGNAVGTVMLGADADNDVTIIRDDLGNAATQVVVDGGGGADSITGRGGLGVSSLPPSRASVLLRGGAGADTLAGGTSFDQLEGGSEDDTLFSADGGLDNVFGGAGFDRATTDAADKAVEVEQRTNIG